MGIQDLEIVSFKNTVCLITPQENLHVVTGV